MKARAALALWLVACAPPAVLLEPARSSPGPGPGPAPAAIPPPAARKDADAGEDIGRARSQGARAPAFRWEPFGKEAFERARREGRFLLLDGAAEWCHWCHVMDETTYLDAEVGRLIKERFVAIRIDVDERPDVAARYEDWGWPATVLFAPDAEEIGKFKGYLAPERMREILGEALRPGRPGKTGPAEEPLSERLGRVRPPLSALPWIGARALRDLDRFYDEEEGGWGGPKKGPLSANVEFELVRLAHGDRAAGERAALTLRRSRALLDPVFGGVYQYSTGGTWDHPHFEKLMTVQAPAIEAAARAYSRTGDPAYLADARRIAGYLARFLRNRDGAFLVSQDADLGAHDRRARFVDGHVYYTKGEAERLALGVPRIDDHVYARENGLAIGALCALYQASGDREALAQARRAADLLLRTHLDPDGSVRREDKSASQVRYLLDAAQLGRGLARLAEVTREPQYRDAALRIEKALWRNFHDDRSGLLLVSTADPAAAGVFSRRGAPFDHNVVAARFLATLARLTGDGRDRYRRRAAELLAALSTPQALDDQGRALGEYLLALDEAGVFPW